MNQKKVWDSIAKDWQDYRKEPFQEAVQFLKKQKGKILDLGCGSGRHILELNNSEIYAVDFSKEQISYAKQKVKKMKTKVNFEVADAEKLSFKNNFFDAVIFINTLHCIESSEKRKNSLKEIYRVLKPKSQALISVWSRKQKRLKNKPTESFIPWTANGEKYLRYTYIYGQDELTNLLKSIGFKIINVKEDENIFVIVEK